MMGHTHFPEYVVVMKVDDVVMEYYDSTLNKMVSHWHRGAAPDTLEFIEDKITLILNFYGGLHTYQRLAGCELDDDGKEQFWDATAYNGMETEKPRVRVFSRGGRGGRGSRGAEVVCLATGFYPRAVEVTLLRDGQPIPEQQLSGGTVLPNGDGTYQLRRSLTVSIQEQREHQYSCTVSHSSMDNKLHMDWELQPELDAGLLAGTVMGALLALLIIIIVIFIWRRKRKMAGPGLDCGTGAAVKYSPAHRGAEREGEGQSNTSSDSSSTPS
ncbi:RLA class I histocompatibility antigen, alpha chain 11/11-like [Amia ocellicauda]|uniref:RLA class I histocompatibility antigen, alpha chain 11/11-like n=1 Tax=Amia ocellicauda TaxID=2972642 RepID=UPI003463F205